MPWIESEDFGDRYEIPRVAAAMSPCAKDIEWARLRKKLLAQQKDDGAIPKDERKEAAKQYKGFCHLLAYIDAEPPGDCKTDKITKELASYADQAWNAFCFYPNV